MNGAPVTGIQIFPANNPWNTDISGLPTEPGSDKLIDYLGKNGLLNPDFGTTFNGVPLGIPYVVVPATKKGSVSFRYQAESDPGPYPIPDRAPTEGGVKVQAIAISLFIDRDNNILYELLGADYQKGNWRAASRRNIES